MQSHIFVWYNIFEGGQENILHLQSVANRAFLLPRAASRCTLNRIEVSIKVVRLYIFAMSLVVLTEAVLRLYFFAMLVSDGDVPLVKNSAIMEFYKSPKCRKICQNGIFSKNFNIGSKFYRKKDMCSAHTFHFAALQIFV